MVLATRPLRRSDWNGIKSPGGKYIAALGACSSGSYHSVGIARHLSACSHRRERCKRLCYREMADAQGEFGPVNFG